MKLIQPIMILTLLNMLKSFKQKIERFIYLTTLLYYMSKGKLNKGDKDVK